MSRWYITKRGIFSKHVLHPKEMLVTSSRRLLFFIILFLKRNCVQRKKSRFIFKFFLIILFLKYLIFKIVSCMHLLFYAVDASFLHNFSVNMVLVLHNQLTKFQYQNYFPSEGIKQYVFLNSCLANWWQHKLLRFIFSYLLEQWLRGEKKNEDGNTKIWIYWEPERAF